MTFIKDPVAKQKGHGAPCPNLNQITAPVTDVCDAPELSSQA